MNIKDTRTVGCINRILAVLLLIAASGTGCVTVSCERPTMSLAGGATAAGYDPCAVKDADQFAVQTLFGSERHY